jgi:hypothetical protein
MEKIDKILNLISEKSDNLYDAYNDLSIDDKDVSAELLSQIAILTELREEVKLIKAEDV